MLIGISLEVSARSKEDIERFGWPMFKRTDIVTLHDKQIPEEYKRTQIIDAKGRILKGDWLEIDRKSKVVKFRRADGKEFEIVFADLSERDRRYAELETGYAWNIGEKPLVPMNLIFFYPKEHEHTSPISIEVNANFKDEISAAEMVGKDTVRVTVKHGKPRSEELTKTTNLPVNLLTENDRAVIKAATNLDVPVFPRPAWSKEYANYWVHSEYHFGEPMPTFKPGHGYGNISIFTTAWAGMCEQFTPEEIYDHIRVRTLTSDFIFKYYDYLIQKQNENGQGKSNNTKSLEEVMRMVADAEAPKERVSLKADIEKSGVKLFEEKTPSEEAGKPQFGLPNGPPLDGELQAYHFIAQYIAVTNGKAKIPFANTFKNSTIRQIRRGNHAAGYLSFDDYPHAIEKTFGVKYWYILRLASVSGRANLEDLLTWKMIRHHIRHKQPVFIGQENGYAILTGFTAESGKETTYDAIMLDGAHGILDANATNLPYKIHEILNVKQTAFLPNTYRCVSFLE